MENLAEPFDKAWIKKDLDDLRWAELCKKYLPFEVEGSIWRYSRAGKTGEPSQGWKLHISATILNACDIFERIASFLFALDVQFKAPVSLCQLARINCGVHFGYSQVGKFLTIYPINTGQAIRLAKKLHELTAEFASPAVPFDEQFLPYSCVYYRYGAFKSINRTNAEGQVELCIKNPRGELVPDDRLQPVPAWVSDPFKSRRPKVKSLRENTFLNTNYQIIRTLSQRGKGGVHLAVDLSMKMPRLCIIKEGRRNGEINWSGFDGYALVKNEHQVLSDLEKIDSSAPKVLSFFEIDGNCYLVMEYLEGESLFDLLKLRRRRFSLKQTIGFSVMIAGILENLHRAGWIWTDCKPANLIVTSQGDLRPVDFEGAHPIGGRDLFDWRTTEFSMPYENMQGEYFGEGGDLYSLGAVLYFLLTGRFFESESPIPINKLRRKVPKLLQKIINKLIHPHDGHKGSSAAEIRRELEKLV